MIIDFTFRAVSGDDFMSTANCCFRKDVLEVFALNCRVDIVEFDLTSDAQSASKMQEQKQNTTCKHFLRTKQLYSINWAFPA